MVEEKTRGILTLRLRVEHVLVRTILQRSVVNSMLRIARVICGKEQKMLAIRQELGPAMRGVFVVFELGQPYRRPPCCADSPQGVAVIGFVDDNVVLVPGASARIRGLRQYRDRSTRCRNFLQMAVGKKSQELAVGRPERKRSALRALDFLRRKVAQGLHPDRVSLSLRARAERHRRAVGRDRRWPGKVAGKVKGHLRRRRQKRPQRWCRLAPPHARPDQRRDQRRSHRRPYEMRAPTAARTDQRGRGADSGPAACDPPQLPRY